MKGKMGILLFVSFWVVHAGGGCATRSRGPDRANRFSGMSVRLRACSALYSLDDARRGNVQFVADVTNGGAVPLTLVHPFLYRAGHASVLSGGAEIRLTIVRPDGRNVVLRDSCRRGFDPGNVWYLKLAPGERRSFDVKWFFQNAVGRWDSDREAAEVFTQPGEYRIRLFVRVPDSKPDWVNAEEGRKLGTIWTGEMETDEVSIRIR